ncbi:MAG: nitroreductase family protein [Pikeienuella sp.]
MPAPNQAALDFLLTRRSRPARTLSDEAPKRAEIEQMLTAAARTPDHGKLEPFRFIVATGPARARLSAALAARMREAGEDEAQIAKQAGGMTQGGAVIVVVHSPKPSEKIPGWEQYLAAGGACLALLNAALAMGWGANWLTGWAAGSRAFMEQDLGLSAKESVVGFVHIGGETVTPPDRPRPDISAITRWVAD